MQAAIGAGLNFIGVTTGLVTVEEFTKYGATTIKDVSAILKNL